MPAVGVGHDRRGQIDVLGQAAVPDDDVRDNCTSQRAVDPLAERRERANFLEGCLPSCSPHRLLLASPDELVQGHVVDLDDLVTHARDVTVGTAHPAADAFDQHLVVLVDEVDGAVADREGGDLAPVLDELDLDALPDGGVGLLGLDPHLLQDDAPGLGRALQGIGLLLELKDPLLVGAVAPPELLPVLLQFSGRVHTSCHIFTFQWEAHALLR